MLLTSSPCSPPLTSCDSFNRRSLFSARRRRISSLLAPLLDSKMSILAWKSSANHNYCLANPSYTVWIQALRTRGRLNLLATSCKKHPDTLAVWSKIPSMHLYLQVNHNGSALRNKKVMTVGEQCHTAVPGILKAWCFPTSRTQKTLSLTHLGSALYTIIYNSNFK